MPATRAASARVFSTVLPSPGHPGATASYPLVVKYSVHGVHELACSQSPWMKTTGMRLSGMAAPAQCCVGGTGCRPDTVCGGNLAAADALNKAPANHGPARTEHCARPAVPAEPGISWRR